MKVVQKENFITEVQTYKLKEPEYYVISSDISDEVMRCLSSTEAIYFSRIERVGSTGNSYYLEVEFWIPHNDEEEDKSTDNSKQKIRKRRIGEGREKLVTYTLVPDRYLIIEKGNKKNHWLYGDPEKIFRDYKRGE